MGHHFLLYKGSGAPIIKEDDDDEKNLNLVVSFLNFQFLFFTLSEFRISPLSVSFFDQFTL